MSSSSAASNSNDGGGTGQPFGSNNSSNNNNNNNNSRNNGSIHFFQQQQQQQQQGISRRSSDADIGSMDDVQFNASLDALLNGDQLGGSTGHGSSNNSAAASNSFSAQHQQQQAMHGAHPYLVSAGAPGTVVAFAPQAHQQQQQHQQAHHQQQQVQQLAGLPLASANQAALHLVPQGAHSAAQMSLSAGHAAATGAFHPGNPPPTATSLPQQIIAAHAAHGHQTAFPWAIASSSHVTAAAAPAPLSVATPPAPTSNTTGGSSQQAMSDTTSISRGGGGGGKRSRSHHMDVSAVSEDEGDREKRRSERNQREQQRSHKITEQIAELREVLSAANQQFKPDKYSTLTKVVDYIKELQERSQLLDVEHKKLIDTISETNEIVNNQYVPAYTSGSDAPSISNDLLADGSSSSLDDESMVYVRGLDYKIAFQGCGIPLALSSIDGRFLDCNETFLDLTGYSREELLPLDEPGKNSTVSFSPDQDDSSKKNLSLFNLLSRDGMEQVFVAMSEMLKHPGSIGTQAAKRTEASRLADFWSGPVRLCRQDNLPVRTYRIRLGAFILDWMHVTPSILLYLTHCVFLFHRRLLSGQTQCDTCPYIAGTTQVLQLCVDGIGRRRWISIR